MFSNATAPNPAFDEGIVMQVDSATRNCKVKTLRGKRLDQVQWTESSGGSARGGVRSAPQMGDRVVVMYGLGFPLIFGFLPTPQSNENAFPVNIDSGQSTVDTGDYSAMGTLVSGDANKPQDLLNGDHVLTSEGGAMLALLRAGSAVLKSSPLCQIFLSKLDDVIKIVSRNFEHYTDVSSDIVKNLRGRVYRYIAYTNNTSKAKQEDYQYHLYYGDTALAEAIKTNYLTTPTTLPSINSTLFKEQVTVTGTEVMHRKVSDSGVEEVFVTGAGGNSMVTTSDSSVTITRSNGATIILDNGGIRHTYSGGEINMSSSGIDSSYSGGSVNLTSSGIQSTFGGSVINLTSSGVNITYGGHYVTVTAAGVNFG